MMEIKKENKFAEGISRYFRNPIRTEEEVQLEMLIFHISFIPEQHMSGGAASEREKSPDRRVQLSPYGLYRSGASPDITPYPLFYMRSSTYAERERGRREVALLISFFTVYQ